MCERPAEYGAVHLRIAEGGVRHLLIDYTEIVRVEETELLSDRIGGGLCESSILNGIQRGGAPSTAEQENVKYIITELKRSRKSHCTTDQFNGRRRRQCQL